MPVVPPQGASEIDFTKIDSLNYIVDSYNVEVKFQGNQGLYCRSVTGSDPYFSLNFSYADKINTSKYKYIEIEYMIPTTTSSTAKDMQILVMTSENTEIDGTNAVWFSGLTRDGNYHKASLALNESIWAGDLVELRVDFFDQSNVNDVMYIKSISFLPPEDMAQIDFTKGYSFSYVSEWPYDAELRLEGDLGLYCRSKTGHDPQFWINYSLSARNIDLSDYNYLEIEYMIPTTTSEVAKDIEVRIWTTENAAVYAANPFVYEELIKDGDYHKITLDLEGDMWTGDLVWIRIDFFDKSISDDVMYIRSVNLLEDIEKTFINHSGGQIRRTLVRYKNDQGNLVEGDMRQGLRFCFELEADIGDEITVNGQSLTVTGHGGIAALTTKVTSPEDMYMGSPMPGLVNQSALIDWVEDGITYKSVYVYNIDFQNRNTEISARPYLECLDSSNNIVYVYGDIVKDSLSSVYSRLSQETLDNLTPLALSWWQ